jgi:hypothetical protein
MLLSRVSHYLAIRLPCEINVPHRNWPGLTIYSPNSSYLGLDTTFPGSTPSHSSSNSPNASRTLDPEGRKLPTPRALFIDRPLGSLYKEDHKAYTVFVEGIGLLAWSIAWLCRSQGMTNDFNDFEEVCQIGRNLYQLFHADQAPLATRNSSGIRVRGPSPGTPSPITFGQLSHGTSHSFLTTTGNPSPRSWKLMTAPRVIGQIKSTLASEIQNGEWEVVHSDEWNQMDTEFQEDPVVIGAKRKDVRGNADGRGALGTITEGREGGEDARQERMKGVNGWTKLKSRNGDSSK